MTEPAWDFYRSFLGVLRQGSLSAAARALGLTQPTLGRHVDELETALGTVLFLRSPHGLVPTEAAEALRPHAEAMASAAASLVRASSGDSASPRGTVRLTASEFVGVEVLPPMLTEFRRRYPGIDIELVLSNRSQDLLRRDADLAVRMVAPTQHALIARKLGSVAIGLFAHRRYVETYGVPRSLEELGSHAVIGFDADAAAIAALQRAGLGVSRDLFALRSDSDHAQLAHVRAGFGIGGCQLPVAARDPDLIPVLPREVRFGLEVWLVAHEAMRSSRRVRLLFEHLAAGLKAYVAQGRGGQAGDDVLYPPTLRGRKPRRKRRGVEQSGSSSGS